jgi:hypothetical protein
MAMAKGRNMMSSDAAAVLAGNAKSLTHFMSPGAV